MTANNLDIDRLVREVMRRLRALSAGGSRAGNANGSPDGSAPPIDSDRSAPEPAASPASEPASQTKPEIRQRVISLETLNGHLHAGRSIRVPQGAVVTPSARDELKRRGVRIEYVPPVGSGGAQPAPLLLATWQTDCCPRPLAQAVRADGFETTQLQASPDSLDRLVQSLDQPANCWGILLTDKPSLALCLANRSPGVRAAWAMDQRSVTDAAQSLGANLLILEPARHTLPAMINLARAFLRNGNRGCPDAVQQRTAAAT